MPPPSSVATLCENSSATAIPTKQVAASAWRLLRAAHSDQLGTDYGHRQKTTGTIQSQGPWDTLSIDIVGPLPADRRQ